MNIFKKSILVIAAVSVTSMVSCKKEETEPIVGTWQKVKEEQSVNGGSWTTTTKACHLDDTEEYSSGGKWTSYDGPNQCNAGTGIINGTWKLAAGGAKVVYTYSGIPGEYESTIEQLEGNKLIIVHGAGDNNNTQYRTTYTKK